MQISQEKLKELLVDQGHIEEDHFDRIAKEAKNKNIDLEILLVEKGLIKDETLGLLIADHLGYDFLDLKRFDISGLSPHLLNYVPEPVARSQKAVVIEENESELKVATLNPDNYSFFKLLEKKSGKPVKPFYVTSFDLEQVFKRYRGNMNEEIAELINELKENPGKKEQNIVLLVNLFLEHAYVNQVSDIHIEPYGDFVIIRFRIDGILHKVGEYSKDIHPRVVSRIKIMAKLRTDERAAAQEGQFSYAAKGFGLEVRVSILPITEGENIVMRLLTQRGKQVATDELGLREEDLKKVKASAKDPYGMIMVAGPTGVGKTTTLYALLQFLNRPEINIMTIEDPVEYNMEGIQQTQVNPTKNIMFSTGLRSIVRQDPDIIMVGEIRDKETVDISINAAMTGHLVLSTIHANDAATTFSRILDMKAESFLTASSINVVIAQRLVRKICNECRQEYTLTEKDINKLTEKGDLLDIIKKVAGQSDISKIKFYHGEGCKYCGYNGYFDRTALFEILKVTEKVHNLIAEKASAEEIKRQAVSEGMTTMAHDGIVKVLAGQTTLEEVQKSIKV